MFERLIALLSGEPLQAFARTAARELAIAGGLLAAVWVIERCYDRERAAYVRSRGFAHDLAYYLYYRAGLPNLLYMSALLALLDRPLAVLDIGLAATLPAPLQIVLAMLIGDAVGYWAHRAQHRYAWLWAFHTTHHAPRQMNVFTGARFHPIDAAWLALCAYVPLRVLGGSAALAPWLAFALWAFNMLIHSRIPWSYGPLYRVIVSPVFHAFHHSMLPEHHDRNFSSGLFSVWDTLFGTATGDPRRPPTEFGLVDLTHATLLQSLAAPFKLLVRRPRAGVVAAAAEAD